MASFEWIDWALPLSLLLLALSLLYLYVSWPYSTWTSLGVEGPKPELLFGNTRTFTKQNLFTPLLDWAKKYGRTYGIYMMRRPVLMTSDPDIIKEVFIKDFANFEARNAVNPFHAYPGNLGLAVVDGKHWRRLRHTLNPTFSASKLKAMESYIKKCCVNLSTAISKHAELGKPLDVKTVYGSFTMDVISGTTFGVETNSLSDPEGNEFLQALHDLFANFNNFKPAAILAGMFPFLTPLLLRMGVGQTPSKAQVTLRGFVHSAIQERKNDKGQGHADLLQMMLDAETPQEEIDADPQTKKRLTADEIVAQGLTFFGAGYETTASALRYLTYLLALHPDKQEKLHQEIVSAIGDEEATYDNVMSIKYLDCCLREALRYFPPAPFFGRRAACERRIKGVTVPAGGAVVAAVYALLRDDQFFPEPDKFLPERFDEDHRDSIPSLVREMVFGAGPRQCIGMRLALYEAKMAAVTVLRQFRFTKLPSTPEKITFTGKSQLSAPTKLILIGVEDRQK